MGDFTQTRIPDCPESEPEPKPVIKSASSLAPQPSLPTLRSLEQPAFAAADHRCSATLRPQSSTIFSLALAGNHLYCGDADGNITVSDRSPISPRAYSSTPVATSSTAVKSIAVAGDKIFAAHQDHKIRVWKIDNDGNSTCQKIAVLPTLVDRCARLLSGRDFVAVHRRTRRTWVHHNDAVSALALSGDGGLLYSASWDRSFKAWRTSDFRCVDSVQGAHDDAINDVVLSVDGFVYTASADKKIKVWKIDRKWKHALVATLEKHASAVNALALSADGSVLYSGACDRSIIVWERDGGGGGGGGHMAAAGALRGHAKAILCLAVVKELMCSGSADGTVRVWRRGGGGGRNGHCCVAVLEGHRNPVKCLATCEDSSRSSNGINGDSNYLVYSGSLDSEIKVWNIWVPPLA